MSCPGEGTEADPDQWQNLHAADSHDLARSGGVQTTITFLFKPIPQTRPLYLKYLALCRVANRGCEFGAI